ncbi:MAG: hypothetical protein CISAcid_13780 [uncultured Acidilobus sp. CIS]|nr:MAG: hypothetical protein CISAcid_13780 [uncultured Acidilobus sp. CIS]
MTSSALSVGLSLPASSMYSSRALRVLSSSSSSWTLFLRKASRSSLLTAFSDCWLKAHSLKTLPKGGFRREGQVTPAASMLPVLALLHHNFYGGLIHFSYLIHG